MNKLLFGISGLPNGDGSIKYNYATGIDYLKKLNLDAMELPFVRSINITEKNKDAVLKSKDSNDLYLSAHGSYFINLNAKEIDKVDKSLERIENGALALKKVEGRSLVFHPGYYLGDAPEKTYAAIKSNLERLKDYGVTYRLETTGKPTQFGSLEEIVSLSKEITFCEPCIDFSHIHARNNGTLKEYDDFARILEYIGNHLGEAALKDMHIHASGINYGVKGEKNHLPFMESDFRYDAFIKALISYDVKGCIICESPILEKDSLLLKELYENM